MFSNLRNVLFTRFYWFWLRTSFVSHRQDENLEVSKVKIFWEDFVLGQMCLKI